MRILARHGKSFAVTARKHRFDAQICRSDTPRPLVGAWLANDSGVSGNRDARCATAIAGKPGSNRGPRCSGDCASGHPNVEFRPLAQRPRP
ncbi:hypothetical protein FJ692_29885 [Pseudomonas fluorescens]|nr:hypothetical protein C1751_18345 [Pseudomonas fluorescens]TPV48144.1 hypothetical protein FJ692_29885 [Pseudomonas fluorescens]